MPSPETPSPGHRRFDAHGTPAGAGATLFDPNLFLLAAQLDDLEGVRKALGNRWGHAIRSTADKDGERRGLGLSEDHPAIKELRDTLDDLEEVEHKAVLALQRAMRGHPLGAWQKQALGVGEKQLARLLAATDDPYWNALHDRPRTVSELWAYCGLHTLPVSGHAHTDTHDRGAGGGIKTGGTPDQGCSDTHSAAVRGAARRRKGQRANWSTDAKTRAYLIATSCIKNAASPYREVYDKRRAVTAEKVHDRPCPQCDGAGSTKLGTPWRPGHQHADALRIVSKALLRDLWRAARDWHVQQT